MSKRVCTQPGCPAVIDAGRSRCPVHERAQDRARGSRQARGYDRTHDRLRATYQARMDAGEVFTCWRPDCDRTIDPSHWHLGHDDQRVHRGPECPACNLSHAGRASHAQ